MARGPARCLAENLPVGVFFFSDVIIVARKLMKNRKYRTLVALEIDTNFEVSRNELVVTFKNGSRDFSVRFSQLSNAVMWHQYATVWKQQQTKEAKSCCTEHYSAVVALHTSILW